MLAAPTLTERITFRVRSDLRIVVCQRHASASSSIRRICSFSKDIRDDPSVLTAGILDGMEMTEVGAQTYTECAIPTRNWDNFGQSMTQPLSLLQSQSTTSQTGGAPGYRFARTCFKDANVSSRGRVVLENR